LGLIRQHMASFGAKAGEAGFGPERHRDFARYDYFA
jgi:hypothetical protein